MPIDAGAGIVALAPTNTALPSPFKSNRFTTRNSNLTKPLLVLAFNLKCAGGGLARRIDHAPRFFGFNGPARR